jgi:hypothetical protein
MPETLTESARTVSPYSTAKEVLGVVVAGTVALGTAVLWRGQEWPGGRAAMWGAYGLVQGFWLMRHLLRAQPARGVRWALVTAAVSATLLYAITASFDRSQ